MSERRLQLDIGTKLMLTIALLITSVIGFLAVSWTSHQVTSITQDLERKAATYGAVIASQAAASDPGSLRRNMGSLEVDSDVAAVVLLGAHDEVLYTRGTPSAWDRADREPDGGVVDADGRIASFTRLGATGQAQSTVIVELSTSRIDAERSSVRALTIGSGLVAFVLGVVAAWLIARRLSRRLRTLASAAKAFAAGDLDGHKLTDRSSDEIGTVVGAFNEMVSQLRHLIARARHASKRERDRLEGIVAARTAALDVRNAEMRLMFDHVEQGFLTVDAKGAIASEHSAAVERWLGPVPQNGSFADYVRSFAPDAADWFDIAWKSISERVLPVEICLAQLPSRFDVAGRRLAMSFSPLVDAGDRLRVLVVISDETAIAERERAERDERETTSLVSRLLADRAGFVAFFAEAEQHVDAIDSAQPAPSLMRSIHTLKGICAIEGVHSVAEHCHELESSISDGDVPGTLAHRRSVVERWRSLVAKVAPIVGAAVGQLGVSTNDLQRLEDAIAAGASNDVLGKLVASWRFDRVSVRLDRLADQARVLAGQLCKDPIEVQVEVDRELRLPLERFGPFWATFVHALRNALDHGVETSSERRLSGKPEASLLVLRAHQRHGQICIELEDSGRGIDWSRVADVARSKGLPATTPDDLQRALCSDGLSTRSEVTELSGRGIGLGALLEACESSGGRLVITSTRGVGTKISATWPASAPTAFEIVDQDLLQRPLMRVVSSTRSSAI